MPIYENNKGERLITARELFYILRGENTKTKFSDWIKERLIKYKFIENEDYVTIRKFTKRDQNDNLGNRSIEYYLTFDTSKEICMIENNDSGRKMRKYFIDVEKRYRRIVENPQSIFDIMHQALNQIEENENKLKNIENKTLKNTDDIKLVKDLTEKNENKINDIKRKIDVIIQKDYCLASDIAEQLEIYSENDLPHSNLIGAIARMLGMKISYKHYYEDEQIAVVPDISKGNQYYQVYYKPKAVKEITEWFNKNKEEIEYKIIYERNTKNGVKGEVKEKGYKIENICYKIHI